MTGYKKNGVLIRAVSRRGFESAWQRTAPVDRFIPTKIGSDAVPTRISKHGLGVLFTKWLPLRLSEKEYIGTDLSLDRAIDDEANPCLGEWLIQNGFVPVQP